jgi:hypothetical protein
MEKHRFQNQLNSFLKSFEHIAKNWISKLSPNNQTNTLIKKKTNSINFFLNITKNLISKLSPNDKTKTSIKKEKRFHNQLNSFLKSL